jgi:UDP-N-acetyl-D-mannosaminuronate dehydrogenase
VGDADAVVLVTAHPQVDHFALVETAELFVDLRGITRRLAAGTVVRL